MQVDVETKDCVSLNDIDISEIVGLCAGGHNDEGLNGAFRSQADSAHTDRAQADISRKNLSNAEAIASECQDWILVTRARNGNELQGFSLCTLERIGGTPCVLIGMGYVARVESRSEVLRDIITDKMRRAALSFPDEDVLFAAQINDAGAFEAFARFHDVVPRPDFKPTGEDRAWGKRLAKRYGISLFDYDDRSFTSSVGDSRFSTVLSHESLNADINTPDMSAGQTLLVHGWARSEDLEQLI